jgi:hypothetical protein
LARREAKSREQSRRGKAAPRRNGAKLHKPQARKQAALDAWLDRLTILTAAPRKTKEKNLTLILERFPINRAA